MTPVLELEAQESEVKRLVAASMGHAKPPVCTIYVYLCNGEVRAIPDVNTVRFDRDLLCVCGDDCRPRETFPRKDVYFCSRCSDVPAPPPC